MSHVGYSSCDTESVLEAPDLYVSSTLINTVGDLFSEVVNCTWGSMGFTVPFVVILVRITLFAKIELQVRNG